MKFYGHANLQNNQLQAAVMQTETNFPEVPTVGRLIFKDKRVYICAEIRSGLPVWIPMTNVIDTYVHNQQSASATWTVVHNLGTMNPLVQIYGTDSKMFIPNEITATDANTVVVSLGQTAIGTAVVMFGDITGGDRPEYSYTHQQTNPSDTWVVTHALGYYPVVRVFIGNEEVQPNSIVHNSVSQTTITFSQAYVGIAVFV